MGHTPYTRYVYLRFASEVGFGDNTSLMALVHFETFYNKFLHLQEHHPLDPQLLAEDNPLGFLV